MSIKVSFPQASDAFFEKAKQTRHPMQNLPNLPDVTLRAVANILEQGAEAWARRQKGQLACILARIRDLKPKEALCQAALPAKTRDVIRNKAILAFEEMLRTMNYPDVNREP